MIFFALFWCAIIGVFDSIIAFQIYQQVDAQRRFVPANALVLKSEVESRRGNKGGRTYRALIDYQYQFPGWPAPRRSSTVSFFDWGSSNSSEANAIVNSHRAGSTVTAYIDPASPDRSVLILPLPKTAWAILLFLTPFNCVGIGLLAAAIARPNHDPVRTREYGSTLVILPRATPPFYFALGAVGFLSFLGAFVVLFSGSPSLNRPLTLGTLGLAVISGIAVFLILRSKANSPATQLRFDRQLLKLTIPATATDERAKPGAGKPAPSSLAGQEIPYLSVVGVRLRSKQSGSVNKKAWFTHRIVLSLSDERTELPSSVAVIKFGGYREAGEAYKDRIKEELGLTEPGDPDDVELELGENGPVV